MDARRRSTLPYLALPPLTVRAADDPAAGNSTGRDNRPRAALPGPSAYLRLKAADKNGREQPTSCRSS